MNMTNASRGSRKYVYRFWGKRLAIGILDGVGSFVVRVLTLGKGLRVSSEVLENPSSVLIVRLDHIGDLLFSRPTLRAMRIRYPKAKLSVLVSSAGKALLSNEPGIDEIVVWDAPWFDRS
jgi:hypothetical protein